MELPYEGAKEIILVDDVDNREFLCELIESMWEELAEKWGISSRRVTVLCNEGRVKGAIRKGNIWLIPAKTKKPQELKRGVKPTKKTT